MWRNPQFVVDLDKFTEEIRNTIILLLFFCNETRSDTTQTVKKKELQLCKRFAWLKISKMTTTID